MTGASVFAALRHRGPNAFGYEAVAGHTCLFEFGHTRLAVQDLSDAGAQPMWSADGRWLIAFNGEIYNHEGLRRHLMTHYGSRFRGHGDTETLVELIAQEGIAAAVARLDGMYAFVVLDRACGALHAVRDPVGIKPLYYIEDSGSIAFSSEVRGLAAHGFEPGALDEQAAGLYLQLRYVPSTMTLYRRTRRVAPGTILTWQVGRLGTTPFRHSIDDGWRTIPARSGGASSGRRASGDDLVTAFGARLDASVRSQLIADVPVGVLLSGGLDSAVLAATLARLGVAPPCFTVGFASADGRSETADAAATARLLGLAHHALDLVEEDLVAVEAQVMDHLEEPLGTTSVLAMWHLCRFARSQVTVALAGQGADEPLGGYRRHRIDALRSALPALARPLLRMLADTVPAGRRDLARALEAAAADSWLQAHVATRQVFSPREVRAIAAIEPLPPEAAFAIQLEGAPTLEAGRSDLARSLWLDARTQLADDLLLYGDKMSMAHSLEVRVPYLGAGLLAMMENLPDARRVDYRQGKRILRAWARQILPEQVVRRPKRGFLIPNLFRSPRFRDESIARARACLGSGRHGLGWDADRIAAVMAEGAHGGAAEVRAWTLHSLARWIELRSPSAAGRDAVQDGGRHGASAERTPDDTVV